MTKEDAPRHPGGRPELDPSDRRAQTVSCRVRHDERDVLETRAADQGMSIGQFVREAALSRELPPAVPAINIEKYGELAKLASNVHQLLAAANSGAPITVPAELMEHVHQQVQQLRLELLGVGDDRESE